MSQMMRGGTGMFWFLYSQKNQNCFVSMWCTYHNQW